MALSPSSENPVNLSRQGQLGGRGTLLVDAFLCARNAACFMDSGACKSFVLLIAVAMGSSYQRTLRFGYVGNW
jgi:hypothetical protein